MLQEVGPDAISLREVARRADVSSRAPYRHFASRDAIMSALATEGFIALRTALIAAATPEGSLQDQAIAYVRFALDRPALYRLMFSYRIEDADSALAEAKTATKALLSQAFADKGVEHGLGCWALVHGLAVLAQDGLLSEGLSIPADTLAESIVRTML